MTRRFRAAVASVALAALSVAGCDAESKEDDEPGPTAESTADNQTTSPTIIEEFETQLELVSGQEVRYGGSGDYAEVGLILLDSGERRGRLWAQVLVAPAGGIAYTTPVYQGQQEAGGGLESRGASDQVQLEIVERVPGGLKFGAAQVRRADLAVSEPGGLDQLALQKGAPGTVDRFTVHPSALGSNGKVGGSASLNDATSADSMVHASAAFLTQPSDASILRWRIFGAAGDESRLVGWGTLRIESIEPRTGSAPDGVGSDGTSITLALNWE